MDFQSKYFLNTCITYEQWRWNFKNVSKLLLYLIVWNLFFSGLYSFHDQTGSRLFKIKNVLPYSRHNIITCPLILEISPLLLELWGNNPRAEIHTYIHTDIQTDMHTIHTYRQANRRTELKYYIRESWKAWTKDIRFKGLFKKEESKTSKTHTSTCCRRKNHDMHYVT